MDENEDGVISQEEFDAMKGKRDRKAKRKSKRRVMPVIWPARSAGLVIYRSRKTPNQDK